MKSSEKQYAMKRGNLILALLLLFSCNNQNPTTMNDQESKTIFPIGEKASGEYFTGDVKASYLLTDDSLFQCSIFNVTFDKGARTNWHSHPSGQILLVLDGVGLCQIKGESIREIKAGDVITFPPNAEHWHGASSKNKMTHIAINPNTEKGLVEWMQRVTDEEYQNPK
jgi:quercetin dioxygenase-like cupin family protein